MKAVRFTKAEVQAIRDALSHWEGLLTTSTKEEQAARQVLAKLDAAHESAVTGVAPAPIEQALIATSRGKVVPVDGGWARASKQATAVKATVEDARLIGAWMARTGWLTGPKTLFDVLNQWPNWLAKAKATAPPPSAPSGFGDAVAEKDAVQGQESPGRVSAAVGGRQQTVDAGARRPLPGFR